jgi:K+-sensing histidine kinase KdpD
VLAVAVVTGFIELLDDVVPVLSLGVLYLFAVLPIAAFWGTAYAVAVAIASMLAFNFFFLPPTYWDLSWMLEHAPSETLVLRLSPDEDAEEADATPAAR